MTAIFIVIAAVVALFLGRLFGSWMLRINEIIDKMDHILHQLQEIRKK